jgi:hypothetical protein
MRAIDWLGLAAAVVIALVAQIIEPWSRPWWAAMSIASLIGVAAIVHIVWNLFTKPRTQQPTPISADRLTKEGVLISKLRGYREKYSYAGVHIHFVGPRRPIAETLRSSFRDAGWQTDVSQRAYETFVPSEYPTGIEIRGINSNFTRTVTSLLIEAGYSDAKPVIALTTLNPSAENWDQANQRVMIVVGYSEADNKLN